MGKLPSLFLEVHKTADQLLRCSTISISKNKLLLLGKYIPWLSTCPFSLVKEVNCVKKTYFNKIAVNFTVYNAYVRLCQYIVHMLCYVWNKFSYKSTKTVGMLFLACVQEWKSRIAKSKYSGHYLGLKCFFYLLN